MKTQLIHCNNINAQDEASAWLKGQNIVFKAHPLDECLECEQLTQEQQKALENAVTSIQVGS